MEKWMAKRTVQYGVACFSIFFCMSFSPANKRVNTMMRKLALLMTIMLSCAMVYAEAAEPAGAPPVAQSDQQLERCKTVMQAQLAKPFPPDGLWHAEDLALAAYWLNQGCDEADRALVADAEHLNCSATSSDDSHSSYAAAIARRNSIEYAMIHRRPCHCYVATNITIRDRAIDERRML
jgi:hypothetical protein